MNNPEIENRKNEIREISPLMLMGLVNLYEGLADPIRFKRSFSVQGLRIHSLPELKAYLLAVRANFNRCSREMELAMAEHDTDVLDRIRPERDLWESYYLAIEGRITDMLEAEIEDQKCSICGLIEGCHVSGCLNDTEITNQFNG